MPKLEVQDGIEIFYEELGSGDKYVISMMMDFPPICATRELASHGYHVFLLTNRGIGKSTHIFEDFGTEWYNLFSDDVVSFADKMGIGKFVYMGCSHGAGTGWHVALRYPERLIAFVAMVGGPHNLDEGHWSYKSRSGGMSAFPPPPVMTDEAIIRRDAKNSEYYKKCAEEQTPEEKALDYRRPLVGYETEEKLQAALRTIETPTLMIGCIEDPISRPDLMLRTAQCLPHGKTILYSGFAHSGPYAQIVEETVTETLFFLSNVDKTGRVYQKVSED